MEFTPIINQSEAIDKLKKLRKLKLNRISDSNVVRGLDTTH